MSQRGRGSRGRAIQQRTGTLQQEQQLPHAQVSSSGAVRRPGQPAAQASTSTGGRGQKHIGEKGDSAAVGQLGRGFERMGIQSGSGSGDAASGPAPVVSGGRGCARGKRILPADIFVTKPSHIKEKKGTSGRGVMLQTNYFKLLKATDWAIHQYHVDFAPEEDRTAVRKGLLKLHHKRIGPYIFDGTVMYTSHRLPEEKLILTSTRQSDEQHITITVRLVGDMLVGDIHYIQFFNIIMRKCYEFMQLKLVGRNYFDPESRITLPEYQLELWPGYVTSIRQHEHDILMCAEITSKVMRLDTLVDILNSCYQEDRQRYRENFVNTVIGTVVLTHYNNNTYRIEDVDFSTTPTSSFPLKNGDKITYIDYYKKKYGIVIKNQRQPMLVTKSKTRDRQAAEAERVYLVPELCRATGLTDFMRENYRLMASVATHTRLSPRARIGKLMNFNQRLHRTDKIVKELSEWNLQLDNKLLDIPARVLPNEQLRFGGNSYLTTSKGDWSKEMQTKSCLVSKQLRDWIIIIADRDKSVLTNFINLLIKVAKGISFCVEKPQEHIIRDDRPGTYSETLEQILSKKIPQLVFCVVSNNRSDRYSAIKKKCCVDRPIPSQVCLIKTLTHRNIMSIATKIAIQMNCKLGGAPWCVDIPLEGLMVVGFDVCHDTTVKSKDFGAMVATLDKCMTRYFSATNAHANGEELSNDLSQNICKAAQAYYITNKALPSRIVVYRDGVGDGQIPQVMEHEVVQIRKSLDVLYGGPNKYKMAFIIVTKRLNTRFFFNNDNPEAGTVVDDIITSPIKYDFFIVSQHIRQGTISPTSYSVIYDNLGLDADKIQRMTYKLTHMYYNCSNTVRVPAPCHYAHKLAFLVSRFIHRSPDSQLQNSLYFL
ncbi:piwi-like protein Siwi [Cataglyphis hispanica]|uniref:piwi-like protein Siwi n=1 Tax=Cataglyphis hispanica TaxID=1086592 RepID=UPI00217F4378|nr:piwi-like protein Siwi [Cataglyphis hispanica]